MHIHVHVYACMYIHVYVYTYNALLYIHNHSELYAADADQKHIFPVFIEDVDFQRSQKSMGVKYVIGGLEWLYFRSGFDNYDTSLTKLTKGLKAQGTLYIYMYVNNWDSTDGQ